MGFNLFGRRGSSAHYYFSINPSLADRLVSRIQQEITSIAAEDRNEVVLSRSAKCSLPDKCRIFEVPCPRDILDRTRECSTERQLLESMEADGTFAEIAEAVYDDLPDKCISGKAILVVFCDRCPRSRKEGILIVWSLRDDGGHE